MFLVKQNLNTDGKIPLCLNHLNCAHLFSVLLFVILITEQTFMVTIPCCSFDHSGNVSCFVDVVEGVAHMERWQIPL